MVKNIIKLIGLSSLILFSFFYTERAMFVINEQDKLMIELKENIIKYEVKSINALINDETIIPGSYGKKVNINDSYKNMKKYGIFNQKLLIYDDVKPDISLFNSYDKYIISGNKNKKKISILFIINNINALEKFLDRKIDIKLNFFITDNIINNNLNKLYLLKQYELYYYTNYTSDLLMLNNNKINNIASNNSNYCLVLEKNIDILNICSSNKMYTILPNMVDQNYSYIKENISNGNILVYYLDNKTLNELSNIINFIQKKGYQIVGLSNLLSEK